MRRIHVFSTRITLKPFLRRIFFVSLTMVLTIVFENSILLGASNENDVSQPKSETVKVAKPVNSSATFSAESVSPSSKRSASDERSAMTRGKLAILGIRSTENIKSLYLPDDSFLVLIPTTGHDAKSNASSADSVPADQSPLLLADKQEKSAETEDRYFVCLVNHLPVSERNLLTDATDGQWDHLTFLDAVLIADGISDNERENCRQIYDRYLSRLRDETKDASNELEKAQMVYEFLHREILTGSYNLNRSSAAVSLQTGGYNCVSATALFNALADDVGLTSYGLEMTGHAKSRVICDDHYLDIETTCPKWELLPDKPVPITSPVNLVQTVSRYPSESSENDKIGDEENLPVDPKRALTLAGRKPVRAVTPVQFVATIYYNRAVDYYQEGKFDQAIYAYLKAIAVDPNNQTVLGNFKATLNNLAIELASRNKNYGEAIRLTEQGLALDPDFDQFRANLPLYYRHWSDDLRKNNKPDEARNVEARFRRSFPQTDEKIF